MSESAPPPPAGWYADPREPAIMRYWRGETWSDHTMPLAGGRPPRGDLSMAPPQVRQTWLRVLLTIAIVIVGAVPAYVASRLVEASAGVPWGDYAGIAVQWPLLGWLASRVSYRWRDVLFMLIPFYGLYWLFMIAWRLAYLPYRDWLPRPDEAASWVQVSHPTEPGGLLFVRV